MILRLDQELGRCPVKPHEKSHTLPRLSLRSCLPFYSLCCCGVRCVCTDEIYPNPTLSMSKTLWHVPVEHQEQQISRLPSEAVPGAGVGPSADPGASVPSGASVPRTGMAGAGVTGPKVATIVAVVGSGASSGAGEPAVRDIRSAGLGGVSSTTENIITS